MKIRCIVTIGNYKLMLAIYCLRKDNVFVLY